MLTEKEFEICQHAISDGFLDTLTGIQKYFQRKTNHYKELLQANDYETIGSYKKSSGFGAESYENKKTKEIIISIAGACGPADYGNMIGLASGFLTKQYNDALEYYYKIKDKYPDYKVTVTGSSLGGTLAQAIAASTGCRGVAINSWGIKDLLPKIGMNPNSKYPNITNYRASTDVLYLLQNSSSDNCIGETYIIPTEDVSPLYSHQFINNLVFKNSVSSEQWEKEHGKRSLADYLIKYPKTNRQNGANTAFAVPINKSPLQSFDKKSKDKRTPSQKVADEIDNDEWDCNEIAFLEGFNNDQPDKHLITEAKERRKNRAKTNGNKGKGPNGEDGYWYTTKKGKHVFVAEDKIA